MKKMSIKVSIFVLILSFVIQASSASALAINNTSDHIQPSFAESLTEQDPDGPEDPENLFFPESSMDLSPNPEGSDQEYPLDLDLPEEFPEHLHFLDKPKEQRECIPPTADEIALTQALFQSFDCSTVTDVPVIECEALVALYNSTNGAGWKTKTNWLLTTTVDNWYGVNVLSGHVSSLYFYRNLLSGGIPPELGNLSNLQELNLIDNQLSGNIPSELGDLSNLSRLALYSNQLTGNIPSELGDLSNLKELYLTSNRLSGSIPPAFGSLLNLQELDLSNNQLSGNIPSELGDLTNLSSLALYNNQLTGNIPLELGNLSKLSRLWLDWNQLSGVLPPALGILRNLQKLDLAYNQLSGEIPSEWGNLVSLQELKLESNNLTGSIPPELGNLSNLSILNLAVNQLSGSLPSMLGNLISLQELDLTGNQFSGNLPQEYGKLRNLSRFYLSSNQLSGSIPLSFINIPFLTSMTFFETDICEPSNPDFFAWKANITAWNSTRDICTTPLYSISGQVTDENELPLGGVSILCNGQYYDKSVSTGTDGTYVCDNLPPDMYLVEHPNSGLQSEVNLLNFYPSVYGWFFLDRNRSQLNFRVSGFNGTFYGVIKDSQTNLPIANASVKLGGAQPVITGMSGEYTISAMGGYYVLTVSAPGYISQNQAVNVFTALSLEKNITLVPYPTNVYRLPYPAGKYQRVTQGNFGSTSHLGIAKYALDFGKSATENFISTVVAAREGKVLQVKKDGKIVGLKYPECKTLGNYVLIKHEDPRVSLYLHLDTVSVNAGDWVYSGQEIGTAGDTGCSKGIHLHFQLEDYIKDRTFTQTVPIKFFDVTEKYKWSSSLKNYYVEATSDGVPVYDYFYKSGNLYPATQTAQVLPNLETPIVDDIVAPVGGAAFKLMNSTDYIVTLTAFDYVSENLEIRVARSLEALDLLPWIPFDAEINWDYPMIYVQYRDEAGNVSETYPAFVESVGYEQPALDFTTNSVVCTNQDIGLINRTTPYCEQCDWLWEFGDGQSSKDMVPRFDNMYVDGFGGYATPGEYTLSMTMKTALGQYSTSKLIQVFQTPDNSFLATISGLTINVSSIEESAIDWIWDFGDGTIEHGRIASHTYKSEDDFPPYITLNVISENGCQNLTYYEDPDAVKMFLPLIQH